jgi:hypothetical protein
MKRNEIFLHRKNKVLIEKGNDELPKQYIATVLKNIESLGYTFSEGVVEVLCTWNLEDLTDFYKETVKYLKHMVGANVKFKPMYPNFPQQVMDMSHMELYMNALAHYSTAFFSEVGLIDQESIWLPEYEKEERLPLLDTTDLKVIQLGTSDEFMAIFTGLLGANTSISEADKRVVKWFVGSYKEIIADYLPERIPNKENLTYFTGLVLTDVPTISDKLTKYFKTATDVLRLAVALSDGDVSLATKTKFRNFSRPQRRLLFTLLESCKNIEEDMLRYKGQWIRLGERLHPGEVAKKYGRTFKSFTKLRNSWKIHTFNGKLEKKLEAKEVYEAAELLEKRPGEFARRLDHLLREAKQKKRILDRFEVVTEQVSTPVLLQVLNHFENRNDEKDLRVIFPKGNVAKVKALENNLDKLDSRACKRAVKICKEALVKRFSDLEDLGKVYLDPKLKNYLVPFSQRSASKSLKSAVRGSVLPLDDGDTVRFFLWWKDGAGRTDIDLSAILFKEDWSYKEHLSYTNLKSRWISACHSGDITSAPKGACEFVDIPIEKAYKAGCRYIVMSVNAFTMQPYCDLPECFAGWMMRQKPKSGEVFEPKTVQDKIDLSADTTICVPAIIDLKERTVHWADLALKKNPSWANNVEGNMSGLQLISKAIIELVKPDLYTLLELHANARGTLVEDPEEADTVFSVEEGTQFEYEKIISEYLG